MKILTKLSLVLVLLVLFLPVFTLMAAGQSSPIPTNQSSPTPTNQTGGVDNSTIKLGNPISAGTVSALLNKILDLVVQIGVVVVTMGIIYAGFLYATARGNKDKVKAAHDTFYWTIVGAAIVLGAFTLTKVIGDTAAQLFG